MAKQMKGDMFGKPLVPGDLVACQPSYVKRVSLAQVVRCTPARVIVNVIREDSGEMEAWERQARDCVFLVDAARNTDEIRKLLSEKQRLSR